MLNDSMHSRQLQQLRAEQLSLNSSIHVATLIDADKKSMNASLDPSRLAPRASS